MSGSKFALFISLIKFHNADTIEDRVSVDVADVGWALEATAGGEDIACNEGPEEGSMGYLRHMGILVSSQNFDQKIQKYKYMVHLYAKI